MISLSYKKSGNRVTLHVENPNRVQIRFSKSLGEILGLNPDLSNKLIGNDIMAFTYAVNMNMTHHQMFVYSDVADYTYVGNITAPLLRIVSYKQSKSSTQSHQEFVNCIMYLWQNLKLIRFILISKMKLAGLSLLLVGKL